MQVQTLLLALCLSYEVISVNGKCVELAPPCTDEALARCKLPFCRCSSTQIPGGLRPDRTPQLVFITFEDSLNSANHQFYKDLFANRFNPNGHPITGTFYVSHDDTNYIMVNELYRLGHEIALHSITHNKSASYWRDMNESMWDLELVQQRDQMAYFARIPEQEIKGMRAPILQVGGDRMYSVLFNASFHYESSMPTAFRNPGLWPYTNDYASIQDCQIQPCRVGKYEGFWTIPMIESIGDDKGRCMQTDFCTPWPKTPQATCNLLMSNFQTHYKGNRAPFGVYLHHEWLNGSKGSRERWVGFKKFMDRILTFGDVYIVSVIRGLEWVKNPQDVDQVKYFDHFKVEHKPDDCLKNSCYYGMEQTPFKSERDFHSCQVCPEVVPWLGNPLGKK